MVNRLRLTESDCYLHRERVYISGIFYEVDIVNDLSKSPFRVHICEDCAKSKSFFFVNNYQNVVYNKVKTINSSTIETECK
jgi:hypothetical protein